MEGVWLEYFLDVACFSGVVLGLRLLLGVLCVWLFLVVPGLSPSFPLFTPWVPRSQAGYLKGTLGVGGMHWGVRVAGATILGGLLWRGFIRVDLLGA